MAKVAVAVESASDASGRGGGRHHGGDAVPRDDEHHQFYSGDGPCRAGLCLDGDAALFAGAEILQQPRQDERGAGNEREGAALSRRFQRMDERAHDGVRHGSPDGTKDRKGRKRIRKRRYA